ncbi:hypothetical protein MUK70_03670 [Dyadobacter chenwenxiniae]|uniref:Lipoprotein n=1 Tax=Dyadobacter chenwenxiniae TaxID=2906456 RepID=A0A9X1PRU7_9BACT|nr:hypothetical protein [Dyadobacter chenwenxiniae]MCF0065843.1 hypothetical protein [Dyadobacter chenwenxiniae]UON84089.1 hypothetical protein MUK70_03670 [Dyadobacter chenwenxiniae]
MKNVLISTAMLLLSLSIFSCEKPNELTPDGGAISAVDAYQSAPNEATTAMQVGGTTPKRKPPISTSSWKYVHTATVPFLKGLKLTSPFSIVDEHAGDISWGSGFGCYNAINTESMHYANAGIQDVSTLTKEYLDTLKFYIKGGASWAPAGSTFWTNHIPVGTVLVYKTPGGKYILVQVKNTDTLVLDIYHENVHIQY